MVAPVDLPSHILQHLRFLRVQPLVRQPSLNVREAFTCKIQRIAARTYSFEEAHDCDAEKLL